MLVIVLIAVITLYFVFGNYKDPELAPLASETSRWATVTDEQAEVTVEVTPLNMDEPSNEWVFDIVMSTHSVELDQDLLKASGIVDDGGKEYSPLRWEGPIGGHHVEGQLFFTPIKPFPKSIDLKISGIGGVERSFIWNL